MSHSKSRIALRAMTPGTGRSITWHRFGKAGAVLFRIAGARLLGHRKGMSGLDD